MNQVGPAGRDLRVRRRGNAAFGGAIARLIKRFMGEERVVAGQDFTDIRPKIMVVPPGICHDEPASIPGMAGAVMGVLQRALLFRAWPRGQHWGTRMKPAQRDIHLGTGDGTFPEGTHICLIYSDEAERREAIGRYLAMGLTDQDKVSYFADTTSQEEIQSWLDMISRDEGPRATTRDIEWHSAESVYCPQGRFDPEEMLERLGGCYQNAVAAGRAGARVSGEMTWALKGIPGSHRLIEYEARINILVEEIPSTAVCQYDARRFDGATLLEVLRVHPMMIVRGQIVRNPYYLRPEEYFRERSRLRTGHGA